MLPVTQATSATTTGHDDAFILAVCAEHAEALAGVLAHPSDDNAPASRRYLAALEAVLQIEPRTIAGLVAKARATAENSWRSSRCRCRCRCSSKTMRPSVRP